jgi:hypothetical protein
LVVSSFPTRAVFPEKGEDNLSAGGESFCGQVYVLEVPSALFGIIVARGLPAIETPMHKRRLLQQKAEFLSARKGARFIVKTPVEVFGGYFLF